MRFILLTLLLFSSFSNVSMADDEFRLPFCEEEKVAGWSFYCRAPEEKSDSEDDQPEPSTATPKEPEKEPEKNPATAAMMEFRAMVDEAKYKAVLDPTPENVLAYMELNKLIAEKAGEFTDQWQRQLFAAPHLDKNVEYPLAQAGIGVYQEQLKEARQASFQKTARTSGIMFMFEDSSKCGMCRLQGEVLAFMQEEYEVSVLAVSKDGGQNEYFPEARYDPGRLQELGLEEFPAPTLALIHPQTKEIKIIGSGLLTADQVLERVYVITEVPVGERY
jgi:conjugal transfer pilus assembly protein TraF